MLAYKESEQGQILHVGINEAGSVAAFTAAGTSYATHGEPMIPVYVFYSMFGFQRTGDSIWAAADQMARGFLIGATAGRTTLTGEGLQHADGHSPLLAATNPAVVSYDPAYGYEIAHIVQDGLRRMYGDNPENVIYYLTVYNEPIVQPAEPEDVDVEGILRGMYLLARGPTEGLASDAAGGRSCSPPASACRGRSRRSSCCAEDWGVVGRRLVGHLVDRAAPRRAGLRRAGVPPPRAASSGCRTSPSSCRTRRARSSRCRTTCAGAGPDPPVRAGRLRDARRRRLRLLRHPPGGAPVLPHRRPVARGADAAACWPSAARSTADYAAQGGREVPPARRQRRHHRQRRRRVLGLTPERGCSGRNSDRCSPFPISARPPASPGPARRRRWGSGSRSRGPWPTSA